MEDLDIIKESDNYRVRLELDEYPEKPYDEGATPILSREFRGYRSTWEAFNEAGEEYVHIINRIAEELPGDVEENIERFLRIFCGTYSVTWDSSEYNRYVSFDTAAWREKMGLTDEYLERSTIERDKLSEGSLTEVMAWAEGDVYGIIEERKLNRQSTTVYTDPETGEEERTEADSGPVWDVVEAVWGFYGRKYAVEEAEGIFDNHEK